ncbi:hypothetical protein B484DRAFT_456766 [Ochromonadaceae sp. CCMP2298]|nr:hypothetical protein B484DRAFT_456766 [Ochromonadaceae sp. CCMP2298]
MATVEEYVEPEEAATLQPGEALIHCNGVDITTKAAGKNRNKIMVVLPSSLVLPTKFPDFKLGSIRGLNSESPEMVVNAQGGQLVFRGRFEYTSTRFLAITCQPSTAKKMGQATMADAFDRVLVFGEPIFVEGEGDEDRDGGGDEVTMVRASTTLTGADAMARGSTMSRANTLSGEEGLSQTQTEEGTGPRASYRAHFGMSSLADPVKARTLSSMKDVVVAVGVSTFASTSSSKGKSGTKAKVQHKSGRWADDNNSSDDGSGSGSGGGEESDNGSEGGEHGSEVSAAGEEDWGDESPVERRASSQRQRQSISYVEVDGEDEFNDDDLLEGGRGGRDRGGRGGSSSAAPASRSAQPPKPKASCTGKSKARARASDSDEEEDEEKGQEEEDGEGGQDSDSDDVGQDDEEEEDYSDEDAPKKKAKASKGEAKSATKSASAKSASAPKSAAKSVSKTASKSAVKSAPKSAAKSATKTDKSTAEGTSTSKSAKSAASKSTAKSSKSAPKSPKAKGKAPVVRKLAGKYSAYSDDEDDSGADLVDSDDYAEPDSDFEQPQPKKRARPSGGKAAGAAAGAGKGQSSTAKRAKSSEEDDGVIFLDSD